MKDPAMLFYTSDFLTGVQIMSMKERGQYITLLCLQQQRGHMPRKDMEKAVGKMSEELLSKFVEDEDGKLYNMRAEYEINRREAHSKAQKEKINRRWSEKDSGGNNCGNTVVSTTVLPLETETAIEKDSNIQGVTEDRGVGGKKPKGEPELARVMTLYMDRIQALPSSSCAEALKDYIAELGADVVCHAIERAMNENKRSWSYINGILRNYSANGLTSLDAVQRAEAEFRTAKRRRETTSPTQPQRRKSFSELITERTGTK